MSGHSLIQFLSMCGLRPSQSLDKGVNNVKNLYEGCFGSEYTGTEVRCFKGDKFEPEVD